MNRVRRCGDGARDGFVMNARKTPGGARGFWGVKRRFLREEGKGDE